MTRKIKAQGRRLAAIARAVLPIADSYGRRISLRFMAFLMAASFSATLVAGTVTAPPIV